jgi:hypothetical protein
MSAAEALVRIGTADLGAEADDYHRHIRDWIAA